MDRGDHPSHGKFAGGQTVGEDGLHLCVVHNKLVGPPRPWGDPNIGRGIN